MQIIVFHCYADKTLHICKTETSINDDTECPIFGASISKANSQRKSCAAVRTKAQCCSSVLRLLSEGKVFFTQILEAWLTQRAGQVLLMHCTTSSRSQLPFQLSHHPAQRMLPTGALAAPLTASLIGWEQTGPKSQEECLQCIRCSSHSGYDLAKCYFWLLTVCCWDCSTATRFIPDVTIKPLFNSSSSIQSTFTACCQSGNRLLQ